MPTIGQFCELGRVKPQKCRVNGGVGGFLSTENRLLTKQAIITISLVCVFGCRAVRTNNVAMTSGGGGAFTSVATVIDVAFEHVMAKLHQVDCCTLFTW